MNFLLRSIPISVLLFQVFFASSTVADELGKQAFSSCSLCHGADGKGAAAGDIIMAPSLVDSGVTGAKTAEPLVAVILKGIAKRDNKWLQQMVPLEAALTDDQIAAVSNYVRKEMGGIDETPVSPDQVKKWRKKYGKRSSPWERNEVTDLVDRARASSFVSELSYSVYEGKWSRLPDFSLMSPVLRGEIPDGILSLEVAKNRKAYYGIVFEGKLKIPQTEAYRFTLSSDDGSALVIDGEGVIDNDGIHPNRARHAGLELEAGEHSFKVLYFQGGGTLAFGFSMAAKSVGEIQLSRAPAKKGGQKKVHPPIILEPADGEAIVHRAFLPDAKPRAIAVGFPGGLNLVWNADTLNLDYLWRGAYLDTSPHWNARGSGSKPVGGPKSSLAPGFPLQALKDLDSEPWIPVSEDRIRYERDVADPKKEITYNSKHPHYQFRGYRLDERRFPTFLYRYRNFGVKDGWSIGDGSSGDSLVRSLEIEGGGETVDDLYFRVATSSEPIQIEEERVALGNMTLSVKGSKLLTRAVGDRHELLARIGGDSDLMITYRWESPRLGDEILKPSAR